MQVDFAGKKLRWNDVYTGEERLCEVLVAVFPHSQQTFVIALPSQKVGDFVHGLNKALVFFGKLPRIILSDNLKSYVTHADRYDPKFNELCVQLATHYQIDLEATRVAKPKDKASVENMVNTVYSRIYAPLRNEKYYSLAELNLAIGKRLIIHNNTPFQKREGSRQEIFERYELPIMRELPSELFEVKKTAKAKVQRNYHVWLGEDKHFYSVPFRYARKDALIHYTRKVVEIFIGNQRVAIHKRLSKNSRHTYQTNIDHMPSNHREWRDARGYNSVYFLNKADQVGECTYWAVKQVLASRMHQSQTFRSCMGIFALGERFSLERLEKAAER